MEDVTPGRSQISWFDRLRQGAYARFGRTGGFVYYIWQRFNADAAASMASALSYTSLLALVPLLVIALAMLAAFPVFSQVRDQFQTQVIQNFVPNVGAAVLEQIAGFVERAGQLTALGVLGLAVTAVLLLVTIETALNIIFRVDRARSPMARLLVYWTVLTLGPLLIGASFSLTGYVAAVGQWAAGEGLMGTRTLLGRVLPTLLLMTAFGLLYFAVPNRQVRVADALTGGVVAGVTFELLRFGFGLYIANAAYETVYGALSAIPIFLVWMYLSWAVVLIGAEITAALPEWRAGRLQGLVPPPRRRLAVALEVLEALYRASMAGGAGIGRKHLLAATAEAEEPLYYALIHLRNAGFVAELDRDGFILARDLDTATIYDLVRALELSIGGGALKGPPTPWRDALEERLDQLDQGERTALGMPLKELFRHRGEHLP